MSKKNKQVGTMSKQQIADHFGITLPTLRSWVVNLCNNPKFQDMGVFTYREWLKRRFVSLHWFDTLKSFI